MCDYGNAVLAVSLALMVGCSSPRPASPDPAADREAVAAAMNRYVAALRTNNADSVMAWWLEDARYMNTGIPTLRGGPAIDSLVRSVYSSVRVNYSSVLTDEIIVGGDVAVLVGTFIDTVLPPERAPSELRGRFFLVWQRQLDGSWKIARAIGTDWPAQ